MKKCTKSKGENLIKRQKCIFHIEFKHTLHEKLLTRSKLKSILWMSSGKLLNKIGFRVIFLLKKEENR